MTSNQMQNLVGGVATAGGSIGVGGVTQQHNMINVVDPELLRARGYLRDKIFAVLLHRQTQTIDDSQRMRLRDISKHLEEGLFKAALTKEHYLNMETLEHRLSSLVKSKAGNGHNQLDQRLVNSSSSIVTMIPSPGLSQSGNSSRMVISSVDRSMITTSGGNTIAPATVNTGSLLSTGGMQINSFQISDALSNGYQQPPAKFSIGSGENKPSIAGQISQMNQESSTNVDGFSVVESTTGQLNEVTHSRILPE